MKVVILESDIEFIFDVPNLPPYDGSQEARDKRDEFLQEEMDKRGGDPRYYVDNVIQLPLGSEFWQLGT